MAPRAATAIDITAPPKAVWRVLTDFDSYPEWNPFVTSLSGDKKVGGTLTVTIKPASKDSSSMAFPTTIQTYQPNTHLHWRGRLLSIPWLFTGHHHFILHRTPTGTHFEHREDFSGILALVLYWCGSGMYERVGKGFALMNEALKERAEGRKGGGEGGEGTRKRMGVGNA